MLCGVALSAPAAARLSVRLDGRSLLRVTAVTEAALLLELQWLRELAELDARGAAGAEQGTRAPSTASWLQARLGMSAAEASSHVQLARTLFGGPSRQHPGSP